MDWFRMLLVTFMWPSFVFWMCRINAMTFKSLSRSITIKNEKLAGMLIAYKNTWGISTSVNKRNKLSILGMISYLLFFLEIPFIIYDWWIFLSTGRAEQCFAEETYMAVTVWFYLIALSIKTIEASKFSKGKIW